MKSPLSGIFRDRGIKDLEEDQQQMIRGIVELSGTTVREVMVPRTDTVFIPASAGREDILALILESGHSRFPVYGDTPDSVTGILHVKDLVKVLAEDRPFDLADLVRRPFFVPDSKHIDEMLREFRKKKAQIAIAVDEYGGVSGIVCMEDIIEEIVGDIQDEFDDETEDILPIGEGMWLCDARANLGEIAEATGMELPTDDFDTLGGFVFDVFGRIPAPNEKAAYKDAAFIVQKMEGHKIQSVKIVLPKEGG
ncbi:MAG: hemolysin family protein [Treponema sp.]|nr:hemolysin family protein [Treponema sp.]